MAKVIVKTQQTKKKQPYWFFALMIFSVLFIYFGHKIASQNITVFNSSDKGLVEKSKIVEVMDVHKTAYSVGDGSEIVVEDILFKAELTSGPLKGTVVEAVQSLNQYFMVLPKGVEVGDKVLLYNVFSEQYEVDWAYGEYIRTDALLILGVIFAMLLVLYGRKKGLQTLISLVFTIMAIFLVFIPAILSGQNIYIWTIVICLFITVMTLITVSGVNLKTQAAIIGCMSGILGAAILVLVMDHFLKLTGVVDEDSIYLLLMNPDKPIDLKGIFFGAIIIGAMGAIMDVSMSISSALYEINEKYAARGFKELVESGINIGRDIMGTMANTLVLAYIGSSLSIVLLLITYNPSLIDLLNRELVVIEILQALIGSLGILLTLPLTAIVSAILFTRIKRNHGFKQKI